MYLSRLNEKDPEGAGVKLQGQALGIEEIMTRSDTFSLDL